MAHEMKACEQCGVEITGQQISEGRQVIATSGPLGNVQTHFYHRPCWHYDVIYVPGLRYAGQEAK